MKERSSLGLWIEDFKKRPYLITVALIGVLLFVLGVVGSGGESKGGQAEIVEVTEATDNEELYVDISGAVKNPGIYSLKLDARVNDALLEAGGLGDEADNDWVSQNLNLAERVKDGQKIYIPFKGEEGDQGEVRGDSEELININAANISQLDTLWGVGEATAKKIIDGRPYSSKEELLNKKVVSEKVYEAIKDKIKVY